MSRWNKNNDKKYELIPSDKEGLFRVKALRDFGDVKAGTIGGYVARELNLSQKGNCWVADKAVVKDDAVVYDDAVVSGEATINGNALVTEQSRVSGNATVSGTVTIGGKAKIKDNAQISGNSIIGGKSTVSGNAKVYGNSSLHGYAEVYNNAEISGNVYINGFIEVCDNVKLTGDVSVRDNVKFVGDIKITEGTFEGDRMIVSEADLIDPDIMKKAINAIISRTKDTRARAFSSEQCEAIQPALKEMGADRLIAAAQEDPEYQNIYKGWREDTEKELHELEQGDGRRAGREWKR